MTNDQPCPSESSGDPIGFLDSKTTPFGNDNGRRSAELRSYSRKNFWPKPICLFVGIVLLTGLFEISFGQGQSIQRRSGFRPPDRRKIQTEAPEERNGVPTWDVDSIFRSDVFTFVRIEYDSYDRPAAWKTDFPDSDLNFSFRLQQMTSMKVDPHGRILRLSDPDLFQYPFIYLIEPRGIALSREEIAALRRYLLNGGFLMVDDFWGENEWAGFYRGIKQVFPEREPVELPMDHPVFHCVYDLKEKPQIPSIEVALYGKSKGITWEREDAKTPHYRGIFDDKGRMMVIICHNTDLGDGWEREGEDPWYFTEFSEKKAYPLGINIVFYAMTH